VRIAVPRDRDGSFEPSLVPKQATRSDGLNAVITSLCAKGMSVREPRCPSTLSCRRIPCRLVRRMPCWACSAWRGWSRCGPRTWPRRPGDLVVWLKPVAVTRAVVRRDGRVQAAGHPADHARLGVAEQRLD
jgi:hypothetical protein